MSFHWSSGDYDVLPSLYKGNTQSLACSLTRLGMLRNILWNLLYSAGEVFSQLIFVHQPWGWIFGSSMHIRCNMRKLGLSYYVPVCVFKCGCVWTSTKAPVCAHCREWEGRWLVPGMFHDVFAVRKGCERGFSARRVFSLFSIDHRSCTLFVGHIWHTGWKDRKLSVQSWTEVYELIDHSVVL